MNERAVRLAAREELAGIAGTTLIYVGCRTVNGRVTEEPALVVGVERKLPLHDLPAEQRIPPRIHGLHTDVVQIASPRTCLGIDSNDMKEYPNLRGGIQIEAFTSPGTLGCIATKDGRPVGLTNAHVLIGVSKKGKAGQDVGQPVLSSCCSGRKIGRVGETHYTMTRDAATAAKAHSLDAGLIELLTGVTYLNEIQIRPSGVPEPSDLPVAHLLNGSRRIPDEEIHSKAEVRPTVWKRGAATGETKGIIACYSEKLPSEGNCYAFSKEPIGDLGMVFYDQYLIRSVNNKPFATDGDSGSVVLDQQNRVVALLWGWIEEKGMGLATPIGVVLDALGIEIPVETVANTIRTVPAAPAPAAGGQPASPPAPVPALAPMLRQKLRDAETEVASTAEGRRYRDTVRNHVAEVRLLLRENWRVAAVWNRYAGPGLMQAIIHAVNKPDEPMPVVLNDRPLAECVTRISAIFRRFGSPALAEDVRAHERLLLTLGGATYNQILARLRASDPPTVPSA
ncbi:MAG TPA: hypothetical protein VEK57_12250 [Thermoanaerobaculia bacterium]|nr:hypothetical protein [Thermoanaerobaculia bacterium]